MEANQLRLPEHIAIILDGNGRWAKNKGMPRSYGHVVGCDNLEKMCTYINDIGVKYLTVYAFSTENWKRPAEEVSALMRLFKQYLEEALRDFMDENIRVIFIGDTSVFSAQLQTLIDRVERESACKTGMVLNIAMNYGGRAELTRAARLLAEDVKAGRLSPEKVDESAISSRLYTAGQPDPDLIIRPSGEHRTSNFLLWQSAYAEYIVMDILWPDFKTSDLDRALLDYASRSRRFGGV